jgi:hypothetical protein
MVFGLSVLTAVGVFSNERNFRNFDSSVLTSVVFSRVDAILAYLD